MLQVGSTIEKWEVLERLGGGGFAEVYKARHLVLGTMHALKILRPDAVVKEQVRMRFLDEARVQAQLLHPNIARVTDIIVSEGVAGLVMEHLEGRSLAEEIAAVGGANPARVAAVFGPILDALAYVHGRGVVHRDIKPDNIFLAQDPDGVLVPKLLDFGIARVRGELRTDERRRSTIATSVLGTHGYMSPEQLRSSAGADARSDIFALGVCILEYATGRSPFERDSDADTIAAVLAGTFEIPPALGKQAPHLTAAVARALRPDPRDRFQTCGDFAAALAPPVPPPPPPRAGGNRWAVPLLSILLGLAVVLAGVGIHADGAPARAAVKDQAACDGGDTQVCLSMQGAACDRGDGAACYALGERYWSGSGVDADEVRAAGLYQRACDAQHAAGCSDLGFIYGGGHGLEKNKTRAARYYTLGCDGGNLVGCSNLGVMLEQGDGVAKDEARAAALYRRGCDGGLASGCRNLGVSLQAGTGVAADPQEAARVYAKACDGGDHQGCVDLGVLREAGTGGPKDLAQAARLFRKGCDGNALPGCQHLGGLYARGEGVSKDPAKAEALYKQACTGSEAEACYLLARMLATADGLTKDEPRAHRLYEQACDGKHAVACTFTGWDYDTGLGVSADKVKAARAYRTACDGQDWQSCRYLGLLHQKGEGVGKDLAAARALFKEACDHKDKSGCDRLAAL